MSDWDGDLRFEMPISWVKDDDQVHELTRRRASGKSLEESVVRKFRLKNNNSKAVNLRMMSPTPFSTSEGMMYIRSQGGGGNGIMERVIKETC